MADEQSGASVTKKLFFMKPLFKIRNPAQLPGFLLPKKVVGYS